MAEWRCDERLKARRYRDDDSTKEFERGYADGYNDGLRNPGGLSPNAYNAGYWEGFSDGGHKEE